MIIVTIILPILGFFFSGFLGFYVGRLGSAHVTVFCMVLTSFLSIYFFLQTTLINEVYFIDLGVWVSTGMFVVNWGFIFDPITVLMLSMISVVSTVVHAYSVGYMSEDPHLSRFMSYLSLFTFFMFILITADNFIQLFLGWEGVGVCSYLLINFWFTRIQANKSALKALVVNRIGDFGFLLGILLIFFFFRSVDFAVVFSLTPYFNLTTFLFLGFEFNSLSLIGSFLFVGSIGKSAQLGLHIWLPDAMEGPTPVSALIHAATMVTAGVFLLIRTSPLLEYSPNVLLFIATIGSLTAFFASTVGLVQTDLKKVIAYSTASQLGYMIFATGISAYSISLFHLINHAFFKALLFLASGVIIHGLKNEQDMRRMGGLVNLFPFTYCSLLIGSLALGGFPFLSGFYSKDFILELAFSKLNTQSLFAFTLGSFSALLTSFYSGRLMLLTFGGVTNTFRYISVKTHEGGYNLTVPLVVLVFGSMFSGFFFKDIFSGIGSVFFSQYITVVSLNASLFDIEYIPLLVKLTPTFLGCFGFFLSLVVYKYTSVYLLDTLFLRFYSFFVSKWYFDHIYNFYIISTVFRLSYQVIYKLVDKGFLEYFGPYGLSRAVYRLSRNSVYFHTGLVYNYICIVVLTLLLLMFFMT
jgi:proton-translocating NADH-quinone oxidoreductase chain L